MLEIKNLHAARRRASRSSRASTSSVEGGRGARHHGPERLRQEHARQRARRPRRATRSPRATVPFEGKDLLEMAPEERAREGVFLAFQYPVEIPGVSNTYFLQAGAQRDAQAPRRGGARRDRLPGAGHARRSKLVDMDEELAEPRRSTTASPAARRSATRSSRWRCSSRRWRSSTRPTPASTSTRCKIVADGRQRAARPGPRDRASSPTTSGCSTTSCPTSSTCCASGRIVRSGDKELALELEEKGYALDRAAGRGRRPEGARG